MASQTPSGGLDFQDFGLDSSSVEVDTSNQQTHTFKDFPDSAVDDDGLEGNIEHSKLLDVGADGSSGGGGSFWTIEYYRKYFNVSTGDVRDRCVWSMTPMPSRNFLRDKLHSRPDLYGPFWICVTLAVSIAVMGNMANYLQAAAQGAQYHWKYDFHKLTLAATMLFCYAWLVPVVMTTVFWWQSVQSRITLLQLISLYGYSLTVFVPVSVVCASGVWQLQWLLMLAGFGLSGGVLAYSLWQSLGEERRRVALIVVAVVLALHLLLSVGFLMYFFRAPALPAASTSAAVSGALPAATAPLPAGLSNSAAATTKRHVQPSEDSQQPPRGLFVQQQNSTKPLVAAALTMDPTVKTKALEPGQDGAQASAEVAAAESNETTAGQPVGTEPAVTPEHLEKAAQEGKSAEKTSAPK